MSPAAETQCVTATMGSSCRRDKPRRLPTPSSGSLRDAGLRRVMGERGRERALGEFSVDIVAAQTLQVYEELFASSVTKKSRPLDSIKNDAPVGDSRL